MCRACFKPLSDFSVLSLCLQRFIPRYRQKELKDLLKLFPFAQEELVREWQAAERQTTHTAKVLLKDAGEHFPSLQCFFPRTALLCVMAPFSKYDQRLLKSVERFPLNPDDVLVLLSWAGLHRGFLLLVLCGRLEP